MSTASILLVEDDPHLGKGISDFLTAKGYAVTWVRDGLAAIHEAHQSRFDLALVDIYLPERDGISVCGVLKDTRRPPPVIAMSAANVHAELREKLDSDLRPDLFLMKPIPLRQLAREIETLLARRRDPEAVTQQPTSNTSGSLALVEALARAVSTGRPGVIEVDALGISTQLYVRNGSIVQAEGGPFSASLWRRLKREEMLSSSQLIDLLQAAQAVYERGLLARPAELVLESGALPVAVVERELIAQVRELTLACFQWENATARFHSGLAHLDTLPLLAPQPIEPLDDGARRGRAGVSAGPVVLGAARRPGSARGAVRPIARRARLPRGPRHPAPDPAAPRRDRPAAARAAGEPLRRADPERRR